MPLLAMSQGFGRRVRHNASVAASSFRVLEGEALLGAWESSPGQERVFCSRCGSPLFKRNAAKPEEVRLRLGCLDDDDFSERPGFHIFAASAPRWSEITDTLLRIDAAPKQAWR